jgi:hypothetical protein
LNDQDCRLCLGLMVKVCRKGTSIGLCLHVPCVAEVDARLGGTLVGAVLQRNDVLAGAQLFLAELASILFRFFRADRGQAVFVSLKN